MPINRRVHLFQSHVGQLRSKHISNLHALFEAHSPSLATPFSALPLQSLLSSLPVVKLGLDIASLEHEYEKYQQDRTTSARAEFDEMLKENAFMDFWGRLGKIGGEGVDGGVQADDLGEDEGEGGGGKVDMKALAKSVDVGDMEKVLRVSLFLVWLCRLMFTFYRATNGTSCLNMFRTKESDGFGYVSPLAVGIGILTHSLPGSFVGLVRTQIICTSS